MVELEGNGGDRRGQVEGQEQQSSNAIYIVIETEGVRTMNE